MQLTRTHRILIGVVVAGAVVIAGIGFAGSYAAVRTLAEQKGFGSFALVFPIGIDAGICVLLALDLLLTWLRIPFPLLRQTAWLLTAATIAFNGAASWPDPLGVGMHAVIPLLFVVTVEAARHAVGRIADITADRHMEGVRITRWLLSPIPTFKLWRRMKLWELRSYEQAVGMEQDRLIYQARLQARYGRSWRRKAPVEALMPLKLARIGVPLKETAPEALAVTGIEPAVLPPLAQQGVAGAPALAAAAAAPESAQQRQQQEQEQQQALQGQQALQALQALQPEGAARGQAAVVQSRGPSRTPLRPSRWSRRRCPRLTTARGSPHRWRRRRRTRAATTPSTWRVWSRLRCCPRWARRSSSRRSRTFRSRVPAARRASRPRRAPRRPRRRARARRPPMRRSSPRSRTRCSACCPTRSRTTRRSRRSTYTSRTVTA
ncbi:DUF2637 domain-containing protein [Streptomyces sp. MS1.HAVA.3]|uniref:DUF2637 domain-containing protein n=1 Tax=Streptomyces caledonius TaxID=3134107 RepID=A0ABU8U5W0_9ACTN